MREIIDWETKGNVVRFYLGKNGKQWGDDWNDAPYEHNAGEVYDEFVKGYKDIVIPFEKNILEPCAGHNNSHWTKQDMIERKVPCLVVTKETYNFEKALASEKTIKYYFGDIINK